MIRDYTLQASRRRRLTQLRTPGHSAFSFALTSPSFPWRPCQSTRWRLKLPIPSCTIGIQFLVWLLAELNCLCRFNRAQRPYPALSCREWQRASSYLKGPSCRQTPGKTFGRKYINCASRALDTWRACSLTNSGAMPLKLS